MTKDNRRAAPPVQAGIDPLVAEAEYMVENPSAWECFSQGGSDTIAKLIAGYRSQAERIAALEEAAMAKDIEHRAQLCEMSERFRAVNIQRVIEASGDDILAMRERTEAAESLLAEAREALEELVVEAESVGQHLVYNAPTKGISHALDRARATISRLKPGEKGGGQ